MKKFFLSLVFLFWVFYSFAQYENINCIIFVDGKLTRHLSGFVEYNNKFNQKDTAVFYCDIGRIRFETTDFKKLQSLSDTAIIFTDTTSIIIHLNFTELHQKKCTRKVYYYSASIPWIMLFYDKNSPIIFSITNFDKRKGTYYFDWMVSNMAKRWQEGYNKRCRIFHNTMPCLPKKSRR